MREVKTVAKRKHGTAFVRTRLYTQRTHGHTCDQNSTEASSSSDDDAPLGSSRKAKIAALKHKNPLAPRGCLCVYVHVYVYVYVYVCECMCL